MASLSASRATASSTPAISNSTRTFLIPIAVQMTVEWTDDRKEIWLRRTAGNSKNTQLLL